MLWPSAIAPAASVGPSVPSVPAARTTTSSSPSMASAAARANSWQRPPLPLPLTVTVVSPPAIRQAGGAIGLLPALISRAVLTSLPAASRASPSRARVSMWASRRSSRARAAAASTTSALLPMTVFRTRSKTGSPGLGVSGISPRAPRSSRSTMPRGAFSRRWKRSRMARASVKVETSGVVGPEAITSSGSPITSERSKASTRAGAAARASCPPLSTEQCFLTVLSWLMLAPAARSSRVIACLSASVIGGAGAGVSAEPPPETSTSTRSSAVADSASALISLAAAAPRSSGTGWPASSSRMRRVGARWPSLTATTPSATREPQASSTAAAMAPDALPAPTTRTRPCAGGTMEESARRTSGRTSPASRATSKMDRATSRSVNDEASGAAVPPR